LVGFAWHCIGDCPVLLGMLGRVEAAPIVADLLAFAGLAGAIVVFLAAVGRPAWRPMMELSILWAAGFILPPLIYFIGLAVLSVPHMILMEHWGSRRHQRHR